ncbi:MAG TPA: hypothetical protein PKA22_10480 [Rhodocyclaceae bacterium]|nr:hypothetical protein [Rhodocyclaceae bacterium]
MPRRRALHTGLLLLLLASRPVFACETGTFAVFACEAARGRKFIELCASSPVEGGFLEYRFGAQDKDGNEQSVEFVYPPSRSGSFKHFFGATYTAKDGVYTQSVRFQTAKASYEVYTHARGMATIRAGVKVREIGGGRTTDITCTERPRFYIHELKGHIDCDTSTRVGRACIR